MPNSIKKTVASSALMVTALSLCSAQAWGQDAAAAQPAPTGEADLLNDILGQDPASSAPAAPAASKVPAQAPAEVLPPPAPEAPTAPAEASIPLPQAAAPASEGKARAPRQIEEIVVTATKREESIRDIPASISAFTGASLENQGKLNLSDFIEQSPGVTASQGGGGFTRITMRGISTDTSPFAGNASPVGIFIGDTAFTDPYIANIVPDLSAFDLAGVQVLKGPQGTLFGGAALSGAVRYELNEPVRGEWQFRGFSQWTQPTGGDSALTSGAALNLPLLTEDKLAFRFGYIKQNYPGVYDDLRTGEKDVDHGSGDQVRAILLWQPLDGSKIKLTHISQNFFAPDDLILADSPHGPRQSNQDLLPEPNKNDFGLDSLELTQDFDAFRVVALSSLVDKHALFVSDSTPALVGPPPAGYPTALAVQTSTTDNSRSFSQELRLQSTGSGPFQWLIGAYYFDYHMFFDIDIDMPLNQGLTGSGSVLAGLLGALGLPPDAINKNTALLIGKSNAKSHEKAIFMDYSYKLWDRLDLSAGARFYRTDVSGGFVGTGILVLAADNLQDVDTRAQITESGINPKFSATFHFNDDISLYATAAKGFRFGGIQDIPATPTNGVPPTFKSDTLWNYELGLRTSWLDDSLHADVTGFYITYKNPIITQQTQGIPINFNANVGAAISRGIETSLLWNLPIDGLSASLGGGLTDAHITAPFKAATGQQVEPGQEMPGAARTQGTASLQYLRPLPFVEVGASAGYTWIGKGYNDLTHDIEINGYGTFNAGLTFSNSNISLHPKLAVNMSNIFDVTRPTAGGSGKSLIGVPYAAYALNPPRTITLRLSLDL